MVRRDVAPDDPAQPTFETSLESEDDDEGRFIVRLRVEVSFRFRDEAVAIVTVDTNGAFIKQGEVPPDIEKRFRTRDCAVLLWPYARAFVGQVGQMTGIGIPPLPTIDVTRHLHLAED